jgi:hypothetical protein
MIAASPSHPIAYLWEPFSPLARPGIRDVPFDAWFAYVCERNQDRYEPGLRDMLAYRYRYAAELRAIRSPKDAGRLVRDAGRFRRFRTQGARPLLKDPIAVFSSEWIADRLGAEVIVLIRHPAAFVNSVVRRELRHPFRDFVDQPLLMDGLLAPFEDDVRRLEDVAQDPLARFGAMFDHLGLPFEDEVRATILEHSDASNPDQVADMASTKRDSRAAVQAWRRSLSSDDLGRIRGGVEPIAATFYGDEDW